MKKVLFILMVLVFAVPALATVTIDAVQDDTDCNKVWIHYTASGEPNLIRAFALNLSVDSGAKIVAISNYKTDGESTAGSPGYGIYMGSIQIDSGGNVTDYNNPVAPSSAPDNPPQLDSNAIIIEMGSLYEGAPNAPGNDANLCAIWVDTECNVSIASDTTRGGVVLEDSNNPSSLVLNGTNVTCGCQCLGELDGSGKVNYDDVIELVTQLSIHGGRRYEIPSSDSNYDECGDLDGSGKMTYDDVIDLVTMLSIHGGRRYEINCPHSYTP
jgi:hypothetical protein